jgi:hypothetical protein
MINQILSLTLFIDDTNLMCVHHNPNSFKEKIEETLLKISKWYFQNDFELVSVTPIISGIILVF